MTYLLDYSAARMTGSQMKAAGYAGAIRYVGGTSVKHTTKEEYNSILAAGLDFYAVKEVNTTDPDGGFARGVQYAQSALSHCNTLGYKGIVFFCNDRVELPNPASWRAYLDGAASVLGRARVGAYGFRSAMDAAIGHADWFWQAGRRSDLAGHVHVWQDNNTQVKVAGIACDRNLIIKPLPNGDDDVTVDELLDKEIPRGGGVDGVTTLRATLAWLDANINRILAGEDSIKNAQALLATALQDLANRVNQITVGGIDYDLLAGKLVPLLDANSKKTADLLAARLKD